jgi:hypothetical protein
MQIQRRLRAESSKSHDGRAPALLLLPVSVASPKASELGQGLAQDVSGLRGLRYAAHEHSNAKELSQSVVAAVAGQLGFGQRNLRRLMSSLGPYSAITSPQAIRTLRPLARHGCTSPLQAQPNPSLNRTCYGSRRKPGVQYASYPCTPGLRRLPPQAG